MPNLSKYVDKFTTKLDEAVMQGTCTADLNMNQDLLGQLSGSGSIEVAKIEMDGLADHTRGGGFTAGDASLTWETVKLEFERDREFSVDAMDDEETAAVLSANLMSEFVRTKVVPEVDAVRFGRICAAAKTTVEADYAAPEDAVKAVLEAEQAMEGLGVDLRGCVLYVSSRFKGLLRSAQNWQAGFGQNPNTGITEYDGMKLVVPSTAVFNSACVLLSGTGSESAGGFKPADDSKGLNFLLIDPRAVGAITKHQKLRYFAPDVNQADDAHKWQYRLYHDLVSYENKRDLIYVGRKA